MHEIPDSELWQYCDQIGISAAKGLLHRPMSTFQRQEITTWIAEAERMERVQSEDRQIELAERGILAAEQSARAADESAKTSGISARAAVFAAIVSFFAFVISVAAYFK